MPKRKRERAQARAEPHSPSVPVRRSERIAQTALVKKQDAPGGLVKQGLILTDLPLEVRLQIYGFFAHRLTEYDERDWESIELTRRSLLLVSRQVNAEWTPLFFSTTTILFKADHTSDAGYDRPKRALREEENELDSVRIAVDTCGALLNTIPLHKLKFVRRLQYEHSISQPPTPFSFSVTDDRGLVRLSHALKRMKASLPNLATLIYTAKFASFTWTLASIMPPRASSAGVDQEHEFERIDARGRHQELAQRLVGERRSSTLRGWFIEEKKVIFEYDPIYLASLWAQGFHMVFKNSKGAAPTIG
ncbi:hypothetical protein RBB50_006726 [Rhinocladiella similis]